VGKKKWQILINSFCSTNVVKISILYFWSYFTRIATEFIILGFCKGHSGIKLFQWYIAKNTSEGLVKFMIFNILSIFNMRSVLIRIEEYSTYLL